MSSPPPQLARKVYTLDDDDDSPADDSSLDIISPVKNNNDKPRPKPKPSIISSSKTSKMASLLIESSESEDDDLLYQTKPTFARKPSSHVKRKATSSLIATTERTESREEARNRKKRETQERKEAEKAARARKRELEKTDRERRKLEEKDRKKRQIEEHQQSTGKFAHEEIAVLMDPTLYGDETFDLVGALKEDFLVHPRKSWLGSKDKAIQWIRKDYLKGGAKDALSRMELNQTEHFEPEPYFLLLLGPKDFLPLLTREGHDVDDDYPAIESYVTSLRRRWQQEWKSRAEPRLIFILDQVREGLDKQWTVHNRNRRSNVRSPPTGWELEDAIQLLLIQFQVECIHCSSVESIQTNVHKLTRGICEGRYNKKVSELQCIKKIKQTIPGDRPIDRARDTWLRQLQQVPRISEAIAMNAVQHYPTIQSLWQVYQHGDDSTNSLLVADLLSEKSRQTKLSDTLYRIMTSDDPKEMIL